MNYEEKTDLELSEMVSADRFSAHEVIEGKVIVGIKHNGGDNVISISEIFSINNPADMWPIIIEHEISLHWNWEVIGECSAILSVSLISNSELRQINYEYTSKNPLRAAAIVFLMMKGVKPDERI